MGSNNNNKIFKQIYSNLVKDSILSNYKELKKEKLEKEIKTNRFSLLIVIQMLLDFKNKRMIIV
jgi:hypothetical protein